MEHADDAAGAVPAADLARIMTELAGQRYATLRVGSIGVLWGIIAIARRIFRWHAHAGRAGERLRENPQPQQGWRVVQRPR